MAIMAVINQKRAVYMWPKTTAEQHSHRSLADFRHAEDALSIWDVP